MLNRDPARVIYISAHALESTLQPENGVEVKPWKGEPDDTALLDLIPFLECELPFRFDLCEIGYNCILNESYF